MSELYKGTGSILIEVIGKSGRGKTAAMRNLPPEETFLINVVGKSLPFLNGARGYKEGQNMLINSDASAIQATMARVSREAKHNYLVLDDMQYIMASEFMQKAMIKGYDKFSVMAKNIWDILLLGSKLRPGLKVFVLTHEEDTGDERKMKTLGRLLDEKLTPEGLATIVLYASITGDKETRRYILQTQTDGIANAKSPLGMFPAAIPNDLLLVARRIDEYYEGVTLEQSKLNFDVNQRA